MLQLGSISIFASWRQLLLLLYINCINLTNLTIYSLYNFSLKPICAFL